MLHSPRVKNLMVHTAAPRGGNIFLYIFFMVLFFPSSIPLNNSRSPSPSIFSGFQSVFHSAVLVNFLKKKNRNFQGCHSQQAAARKSRADAEVRWSAHGSR